MIPNLKNRLLSPKLLIITMNNSSKFKPNFTIVCPMDAMIGNSSSGIAEAPSFKIGTINMGDRQRGRIKARSAIDCLPTKASIEKAFKKLYSKKFQLKLKKTKNLYGDGCASKRIVKVLKKTSLNNILKKIFFNVKVSL